MTPANYRHIGGAVIADHGPITLAAARALTFFYRTEAGCAAPAVSSECRRRARTLERAITAAFTWRRAAGWNDPDRADYPSSSTECFEALRRRPVAKEEKPPMK